MSEVYAYNKIYKVPLFREKGYVLIRAQTRTLHGEYPSNSIFLLDAEVTIFPLQ